MRRSALVYEIFAYDVALVDKKHLKVLEGKLKHWQEILEKNLLKISKAKAEFLELRFK